jgi:hypothetical protein
MAELAETFRHQDSPQDQKHYESEDKDSGKPEQVLHVLVRNHGGVGLKRPRSLLG